MKYRGFRWRAVGEWMGPAPGRPGSCGAFRLSPGGQRASARGNFARPSAVEARAGVMLQFAFTPVGKDRTDLMADAHDHDHPNDHDHDHPHAHPHGHAHPEADPNHVEFIGGRPILNVADVPDSLAYYTQQLGFATVSAYVTGGLFAGDKPPTFAEVARGHVVIFLAQQEQGGPGMWVYLDLESRGELEKLHKEYSASGARIVEPPADKPWGMCEMRVQDLDGHTFRIGAPLAFERA